MAFVRSCPASLLRPGEMVERVVDDHQILLCNVDGQYHATGAVCPHQNGPLAHGALHEHTIVCPWHAWEFDCRTGEHDFNPAIRIRVYAVRVEGDDVLIDLG